ncbi:hypothetical protein MJD09_14320, partial [bacterium]|nr:hypothetical protein [bacterium]
MKHQTLAEPTQGQTTEGPLPECGFCGSPAAYEGRTFMGPVARMCPYCFPVYGVGLGNGRGWMVPEVPFLLTCSHCKESYETDLIGLIEYMEAFNECEETPCTQCCGYEAAYLETWATRYVWEEYFMA